MQFCS